MLGQIIDQINGVLVSTLGELGPLIAAGVFGLLLILVALPALLTRKKDPLDRLKPKDAPDIPGKPV
ncbi:MAG: type II secretion system F family protein, partial [Octadecabacter sp.]|nr:type II secretion system F family protein [Octadecabacter sp.]